MANLKKPISILPPIVSPSLEDELAVVQEGVTYRESLSQVAALLGVGMQKVEVTGITQQMQTNTAYITNNALLISLTLPVSSFVGDEMRVIGKGDGGWGILFNEGQTIIFGDTSATTSSGTLASTEQHDCVHLMCTVADLVWTVISSQGQPVTDVL